MPAPTASAFSFLRRGALQLYRLGVLVAIAWIVHAHHVKLRIEGNSPITLREVAAIFPTAASLQPDGGERRGYQVYDAEGKDLGYVLRTLPEAQGIIGYRGWTDTLVAFDPALHVVGVRVRDSRDTREHVSDIRDDRHYLKTWNGKPWDEIARKTPEDFGIEGVSGATMTSLAIADGIQRRLAASNEALRQTGPAWRWDWHDVGLGVVVLAAAVLAFTGTHGRPWLRRSFQVLVIVYVGFVSGDLLAQSLTMGWMQNGVPWRTAPGLVLLLAAALAVPWASGKPLYCQHLCPHGAAQELVHAFAPKRWRFTLPKGVAAGLRWLPPLLLGLIIIVGILVLPLDIAHLEPFDAYVIRAAGVATISLAVGSLIASAFVPMAYCRYGCPTGALLNFIRTHGRADRFNRADVAALLLVGLAWASSYYAPVVQRWLEQP